MPNHNTGFHIVAHIQARLKLHGLDVALRHFDQAEEAFSRRNWESANAQFRTFLEALFDGIAAIRLKVNLAGGDARKELQAQGVLTERQGKFLQAFMDLAGERGSHAGISSSEEAESRRLVTFGMAKLGLLLLPELVRVEDVLATQLRARAGTKMARDSEILTSCPTCKETQNLGQAEVRRDGEETVYRCKNGCQTIVVIGLPGDSPWPGRGYRLGSRVVRNASDLRIPVIGVEGGLLIPASPSALMKKQP